MSCDRVYKFVFTVCTMHFTLPYLEHGYKSHFQILPFELLISLQHNKFSMYGITMHVWHYMSGMSALMIPLKSCDLGTKVQCTQLSSAYKCISKRRLPIGCFHRDPVVNITGLVSLAAVSRVTSTHSQWKAFDTNALAKNTKPACNMLRLPLTIKDFTFSYCCARYVTFNEC